LDAESTIDVVENLCLLFQHVGEDSLAILGVILGAVSVHEDVFLSGMSVKITEEQNLTFAESFFNGFFHMK
jgi:hypothetical protein